MKNAAQYAITFAVSFAGTYGFSLAGGASTPWALSLGMACVSLTVHRFVYTVWKLNQ